MQIALGDVISFGDDPQLWRVDLAGDTINLTAIEPTGIESKLEEFNKRYATDC